ncbi:MAG TPA: hypothetical protein VF541_21245 [Longimicrobium sp.]
MPVVFDEVVGSVEPDTQSEAPSGEAPGQGGQAPDPLELRRELRRMARRDARLRAD